MKSANPSLVLFSDGACSGNPGPGGWGAVIATPSGKVIELGGFAPSTTNNRMELSGVIHGLKEIGNFEGPISIYTDSTYVIRGITQWIWSWRRKNWQNSEGQEVLNRDLWEELSKQVGYLHRVAQNPIEWHYSRGHCGTPGNERCDEIAVAFSKGLKPQLYRGPLLNYSIAIFDLPENTDLPAFKPKSESKKAYSYLSLLGQEVVRHWTWPDCERRVKGRSGAKFKKAHSPEDELKILEEWGLPPQIEIKESQP